MRVVEVVIASCILTLGSAGAPSAQFVNPLSVLEESRRDRIELDKRIAREAAAQRLRENAAQAAQASAQRKLAQETAAAAKSAYAGAALPSQLEASLSREIVSGASGAATSPANAVTGTSDPNQPVAEIGS